jgi:hypothetical protein
VDADLAVHGGSAKRADRHLVGTTLDVNGDGYADVIVGAPGANASAGQAFLYLGGASGIASSPQILTAPTGSDVDFGLS